MFAHGPSRARLVEFTSSGAPQHDMPSSAGAKTREGKGVAAIADFYDGTLRARLLHRRAVLASAAV